LELLPKYNILDTSLNVDEKWKFAISPDQVRSGIIHLWVARKSNNVVERSLDFDLF
jgi:hypothetical protein